MARLAGITRNNVSKLENGQAADLAEALNILDALGVEGSSGRQGLLQLPEYVRSIHHAASALESAGPVDGFLAGRMGRQRHLRHPGGPEYEVIVDEIAILRRVAPDRAVKAQLRHLAQVAKGAQPNVTLRVLRTDA